MEAFSSVLNKIINFEAFKSKYTTSTRGPAIWNDFVEDCLKSINEDPFYKVKMKSKLLKFDNETSIFNTPTYLTLMTSLIVSQLKFVKLKK